MFNNEIKHRGVGGGRKEAAKYLKRQAPGFHSFPSTRSLASGYSSLVADSHMWATALVATWVNGIRSFKRSWLRV